MSNLTMDKTKQNRFEFNRFVFVVTLLLILIMAARTPLDTDMWWHMQAGKATIENRSPLLTDVFSFSRVGQAWINHSWLAEVIMFAAFEAGGFFGLGLWMVSLIVLSMGVMYLLLEGPPLYKTAWTVLAAMVIFWVWSPRPQLFSLVFFAFVLLVLSRYQFQNKNYLLWLIPVFIFWSNFHGGYVWGFILLFCWILGQLINCLWGEDDTRAENWVKAKRLMEMSLILAFAVLINPNGINTWLIPFKTVGVEVLQNFIDEWSSPNFHDPTLYPFLALFFINIAVMGMSKKRVDGVDLVSFLVFSCMALISKRNFAPFALLASPIGAKYSWPLIVAGFTRLQLLFKRLNRKADIDRADKKNSGVHNSLRRVTNLLIVAILGGIGLIKLIFVTSPVIIETYSRQYYPVEAVEILQSHDFTDRILNSYGWGGYLDWNLPSGKVFVDGRTDLYGDEILNQYLTMINALPGWQGLFSQWDIHYVLLEPFQPIISQLQSTGWSVIYEDQTSILLHDGGE